MPASMRSSELSELLSDLRENAGLSRRHLADLAEIAEGTIKAIERGDSEQPKPDTLRSIAKGLATHRLAGRVDQEQADALYERLSRAAGYAADAAPPSGDEMPPDIREQVIELVGTDEGLVRAILADLSRRTDEGRRSALRFLADALQWQREPPRNRRPRA